MFSLFKEKKNRRNHKYRKLRASLGLIYSILASQFQVCWCMPIIPALRRCRQKDQETKDILSYLESLRSAWHPEIPVLGKRTRTNVYALQLVPNT